MKFRELRFNDMGYILSIRAQNPDALRTPYLLTLEQQNDWYRNVVCNRSFNARYWAIEDEISVASVGFGDGRQETTRMIGYGGIQSIEWENKRGEMSLLLDPRCSIAEKREAALETLYHGFNCMNLDNIYTEDYECNNEFSIWYNFAYELGAYIIGLPNTKFLDGKYYNSMFANFEKRIFMDCVELLS
jgi:hypothetical protein